ncbi:MAG: glycosyltransferase family 2 protein [Vicinamibacterales bacterium]
MRFFESSEIKGGPTPDSAAEIAVKALYERLTDDQKRVICFRWDYREPQRGLLRTFVSNHWYVTRPFIRSAFYTPEQQTLIHDVFTALVDPEWYDRFLKAAKDDSYGQEWGDEQSIAILGTPGEAPFQFVLTGRHMTLRTGGGGDRRVAFGGPILYGHAAGGYFKEKAEHGGNVFRHQAELANRLLHTLTPAQRAHALVPRLPDEADVAFRGPGAEIPGIPVAELTHDQKASLDQLLDILLEPFRKEDRAHVRECLDRQGGLPCCSLAFYEGDPPAPDATCANWRLEGPAFVWYFRGSPHLHAWVHVADTPDIPVNGRLRFVADPWPASIQIAAAAGPKIVAITTAKNEIDIIEAFVRHTLATVSHLVILDNGSTDGTLPVLRALEREGLALTIIEDPSTGKYLSERMTHLMRDHAVTRHAADWVVPLDADEFLVLPNAEPLIPQDTAPDAVLSLPWRTYVPDQRDDPALLNPVLRLRHRLVKEGHPWVKAVVPRAVAALPDAVLSQGNHTLKVGDRVSAMSASGGACLAHFPIRSAGQYLAKMAISAFQYKTMGEHAAAGAFHWKAPYELLKRDQDAFAESIFDEARRFSVPPEVAFEPETVCDPIPYLGGPLLHTERVDDRERGWSAVLGYAEDLARRYAVMADGLTSADRVVLEQRINEVTRSGVQTTAAERLLLRERLELILRNVTLQNEANEQRQRAARAEARAEELLRSRSFRIGSLMLWPARLAVRGLRAAREHKGRG